MSEAEKVAAEINGALVQAICGATQSPEGLSVNAGEDVLEELDDLGITGLDGWIDILTPFGIEVRKFLELGK